MDNLLKATPLQDAALDTDGLTVAELGFVNKINLRGNFESQECNRTLTELLGLDCQLEANTYMSTGANTLFWLGPNERMLYTDSNPQKIAEQWRTNSGAAAVDVSDYSTVLRLSGAKVRDVIASGSPFDVHPLTFGVGQCTQTRFGNASVLLSNHADTPVFQMQVRWSFAKYVYDYIQRVANYV